MKKLFMLLTLIFGVQNASLACEGITGGFGCGGLGGQGNSTGSVGDGPSIGGSGGGVLEGGLHIGTTKFRINDNWRFHTYTGTYDQCKQNVDLDLINNAVLVSACQRVE